MQAHSTWYSNIANRKYGGWEDRKTRGKKGKRETEDMYEGNEFMTILAHKDYPRV